MKEIIVTDRALKPIGPYSQAVRVNGFLFTVQIALDANTNTFLEGNVAQQTERVLENLKAILTHAGLTLSHVVKTMVFLKDMNDFKAMNEVYARYFAVAAPAGTTVQASGLPKDALVEIELVAVLQGLESTVNLVLQRNLNPIVLIRRLMSENRSGHLVQYVSVR